MGVKDNSPESLKKFDRWYFDLYPYLCNHIPFAEMKRKKVMEAGLGYGTVAQKIAETGADCHGLDIADGPVNMVNLRIERAKLKGKAVQGSVLEAPFYDAYFDWVIAIGRLHHTGNLAAPQTEFVSEQEIALMCRGFASRPIVAENTGKDGIFRIVPRRKTLEFGKNLELDLYCHAKKHGGYDVKTELPCETHATNGA